MDTLRLRRDGVACSDLGDEIVILDLETSAYFAARNVAAKLVGRLVDGSSPGELADWLVATYGITPGLAAADVEEFLGQLRSRNLLEPAGT